jgi:hypothetical protein
LDEHFRLLAPLMGRGRDGDVAVLRMAGEHRRACLRLRQVLVSLVPAGVGEVSVDADHFLDQVPGGAQTIDALLPWLRQGASLAPLNYFRPATPPEEAREDILAAARLRVGQALAGEKCEPGDAVDLVTVMQASAQAAVGSVVGEDPPSPEDLAEATTDLDAAAAIARGARHWAETAPIDELLLGVVAANGLFPLLEVLGIGNLGSEDRWRWVGRLAGPSLGFVAIPGMATLLRSATAELSALTR